MDAETFKKEIDEKIKVLTKFYEYEEGTDDQKVTAAQIRLLNQFVKPLAEKLEQPK
ncbi:hypothetical protein [Pediococcus stilesii]|uniref:hypothetical protein n=1 Tax=Pediococcus stilesii TaxID=331679 RepID=UPI0014869DC2|nr:hypothetical protein [Pediococcus stilesii]